MTIFQATDLPAGKHAPVIDIARDCLFLDFDGTLVEFAGNPDEVFLPVAVRNDVADLAAALDGALAVVSGRSVQDVDHFIAPLLLPVAGVHGLMRRDASGHFHYAPFDAAAPEQLSQRLQGFIEAHAGLLLERKTGSLALHFRKRPELQAECVRAMNTALEQMGAQAHSLHLMHGKMVVEARASDSTKASAISAFMAEAPFAGRRPVFAGDDVTDEDGFTEINARGGLSIKIGEGETNATCRFKDIVTFRDWLHAMARKQM